MIVDSSSVVAIVRNQREADACLAALEVASEVSISAGSFVEVSIVIDRQGDENAVLVFEELLLRYNITIEPVTEAQARLARIAHQRFGRGNDSKARLNFGDCFAYALASERNEPLLFVGEDFTHTDIRPAIESHPEPEAGRQG